MSQYRDIEDKKFSKTIKGYDINEVNKYIEGFAMERFLLQEEVNKLKRDLEEYKNQENYLKSALITAEQAASNRILNAEKEAVEITRKSQEEAKELVNRAVSESAEYKEKIFKIFSGYEDRLKEIIEEFYSKSRLHMEQIEREFSEEIEKAILRYNTDFKEVPKPLETLQDAIEDNL